MRRLAHTNAFIYDPVENLPWILLFGADPVVGSRGTAGATGTVPLQWDVRTWI